MGDDADDSVFDWGRASLASVAALNGGSERTLTPVGVDSNRAPTNQTRERRGDTTTGDANIARYTPNTINRITDITDLVADSSEESDDDAIDGLSGKRKNGKQRDRPAGETGAALGCRRALVAVFVAAVVVAAGVGILYAVRRDDAAGGRRAARQQQLLETAERVTLACSEHQLSYDSSDCQNLCRQNMCCFESEPYSCREDEQSNCVVYVACEALR